MFNCFRNLYKIWANNKVVAFITAGSEEAALTKYIENGGNHECPMLEQVSRGYHCDTLEVYD